MLVLVNGARRTFSAKLLASTIAQPKSGNDNRTYGKPFAHTLWKRLLRRLKEVLHCSDVTFVTQLGDRFPDILHGRISVFGGQSNATVVCVRVIIMAVFWSHRTMSWLILVLTSLFLQYSQGE